MSDDPSLSAEIPGQASIDLGLAAEPAGDGGVRRAARLIARQTRSPLPPADEFAGYVQAHKPAGDELLRMADTALVAADRRADDRQRLEFHAVDRAMQYVFVLVLVVVLMIGLLALVLILRGEILIGTLVGAGEGVLVSLIGLLTVWARRRTRQARHPSGTGLATSDPTTNGAPPTA